MRDDWRNTPIHPVANMMPSMTGDEYQGLKASIDKEGLKDAIEKYNGKILEGRHRFRACVELGKRPDFINLPPGTDPVAYVVAKNFHRRHLTTAQRAMVLIRAKQAAEAVAKGKAMPKGWERDATPKTTPAKLQSRQVVLSETETKTLAGAAAIGPRTLRQAQKVHNQVVPSVEKAVVERTVSLNRAVEIADLPKAKQPKALAKAIAEAGTRKKPAANPEPKTLRCPDPMCPCRCYAD